MARAETQSESISITNSSLREASVLEVAAALGVFDMEKLQAYLPLREHELSEVLEKYGPFFEVERSRHGSGQCPRRWIVHDFGRILKAIQVLNCHAGNASHGAERADLSITSQMV